MWSRHVTLWCDFDGGVDVSLASGQRFADEMEEDSRHERVPPQRGCVIWTDHGRSGVEETRALARAEGWVYVEAKDLCPEHARMDPDGRAFLDRMAAR